MRSMAAFLVLASASATPVAGQSGFEAGEPLDLMPNTRVFGSFHFTESCSYDAARDLYVTPSLGNRGEAGDNDGYVSLINPDGTVHTPKWIGITRNGLTLNDPLGSDIENGMLYLADRNVVRWFDMETGEPRGSVEVDGATGFNDLEVAVDGTVYMSQTAQPWRIYRLDTDGNASVFIDGEPLAAPNGVALDTEGNIVVVNIGTADILTFDPDGNLVRTEQSTHAGNDGIVVLADGTKYVSSVREGTIARIRPGRAAEVVATGIPSAASICYDPTRERVVVPMNSWFSLAFVEVGM